jgi:hypothetical protein
MERSDDQRKIYAQTRSMRPISNFLSSQLKMTLPAFFHFHGVCPISSTAIVTVEEEGICPSNRYRG